MDSNTLGLVFDGQDQLLPQPDSFSSLDASPSPPAQPYYPQPPPKNPPSTLNTAPLSPISPLRPKTLPLPPIEDDEQPLTSPLSPLEAPTLAQSYSPLFPVDHHLSRSFLTLYHPMSEIGAGGFGFVLTARDRRNDREVAVKFIVKDTVPEGSWIVDPELGLVPLEVSILRCVKHRGIVGFEALFEDTVYFYLVQELHGSPWKKRASSTTAPLTPPTPVNDLPSRPIYARRPSHDLFECIEQHSQFPEHIAKYIFAQIVDVASYLDSIGVVHRDMKDENLLVDENFRVKLIDFGSAVIIDPNEPQPYFDRFFGTLNFASAEILRSDPYLAPPAEVWSLGVLLSFLITGESPFLSTEDAMEGKIRMRKGWNIDRNPSKDGWDALLRGCLKVNVGERLTISEISNHPWLKGAFDRA